MARRARYPIVAAVQVRAAAGGAAQLALAQDVSAGGVGLRVASPLVAGSVIELRLALPGAAALSAPVAFVGRVVWSRPAPAGAGTGRGGQEHRCGVCLEAADPGSALRLRDFLDARSLSQPACFAPPRAAATSVR